MRITKQRVKRILAAVAVAFIAALLSSGGRASATGTSADDPAVTYKAKCASCHGADGSGNTPIGKKLAVRDLRSADVQKQSDAQLAGMISKGKLKMPAFGKSLGEEKVNQLVAFVRTLRK